MLSYLGTGERRYGPHPVAVVSRPYWEFQAVVRGGIALRLPGGDRPPRPRRLWISPPENLHGWGGRGRAPAEVVVFHFPHVPEPLRRSVGPEGLEIPLDAAQCARIRELGAQARRHWGRPSPALTLCSEHILLELSLLAVEALPRGGGAARSGDRWRVEVALGFFSARIAANPSLPEAARAAGVSPSHLRRLFQETFRLPPKQVFDQLRFQRATQLLADPALKVGTVAEECGFGDATAFSRAFKAKFGCGPDAWRSGV